MGKRLEAIDLDQGLHQEHERLGQHLANLLATFEQLECRHSTNTETLSKLRLLVDIDFLSRYRLLPNRSD